MLALIPVLAFALLVSAGSTAMACSRAPQPPLPMEPLAIETLRGLFNFTVEVARGPDEKACGLMKRPRLDREAGMLFENAFCSNSICSYYYA